MAFEQSIPAFLCGDHATVRRRSRRVARRVVEFGEWVRVMANEQFIPVSETPGILIFSPGLGRREDGENVLLYALNDPLRDACEDHSAAAWHEDFRHLLISGLDEFWIALCHLAGLAVPLGVFRAPGERAAFCRNVLAKLLPHWPDFCELESRFSLGAGVSHEWPMWGISVFAAAHDAGAPPEMLRKLKQTDSLHAGEELVRWFRALTL